MKKVYVLLAEGFELIEALTPVDVLRRGGAEVKTVSISDSDEVLSSQKVMVKSDLILKDSDVKDGDMLILPGGYPGYVNLGKSQEVVSLVNYYVEQKKFVGAICGAPSVLADNNIAEGQKVTCHTSIKDIMKNYQYEEKNVMKDGIIITGMGAGHSLAFALELAESLLTSEEVEKIKIGMEL